MGRPAPSAHADGRLAVIMEKNISTVGCGKCKAPIPPAAYNAPTMSPCAACGALLQAAVFPALFKEIEKGAAGETIAIADESSCFYHPAKKAAAICEDCGRFLCGLCDVVLANRHLCPPCIEAEQKKDKNPRLKRSRVLYDDVALTLAALPILFVWPTLVTAPIAIFFAIRYWNAPSSVLPRTKARFVAAIILAVLQIVAWMAVFVSCARSK